MTKQQIIDAAMQIATAGNDPHNSPLLDSEMTAEDLLPLVFRHVYTKLLLENGMREQDLIEEYTISVVNGVGVLPANVITEYLHLATLPDFPYSSLSKFKDYGRQKFSPLVCYWTFQDGKLLTTCTSSTATVNLKFQAVSIPTLPAAIDAEVDVDQRELNTIIYTLAQALRGEIKLLP